MKKRFVVRKYIMADSAAEALKKDLKVRADDVWIDEDWKRDNNGKNFSGKQAGFKT